MTATWQKKQHVSGGGGESASERHHLKGVDGDSGGRNHQTPGAELRDNLVTRKVLKADREKLRRDRLNEQFLELGNALDPDRPKNDKATILADTIQVLKDLTAQVSRLKAEYSSLSEESRELTQEKNELKEEKAALKSDVDNLNAQYQQRVRVMYPWGAIDPSALMGQALAPPPYPYAVPVTIPSGQVSIHPPMHPYPFFPSSCPPFMPYYPPSNTQVEKPASPCVSSNPRTNNGTLHTPCSEESRSKFSDKLQKSAQMTGNDVATELELKTPGSAAISHSGSTHDEQPYTKGMNKQMWVSEIKQKVSDEGSSSSRCGTSLSLHDCSSESVGDGSVAEN